MFEMSAGELKHFKSLLETKQYDTFVNEVDVSRVVELLEILNMTHLAPELKLYSMIQSNVALFNELS